MQYGVVQLRVVNFGVVDFGFAYFGVVVCLCWRCRMGFPSSIDSHVVFILFRCAC